MLFQNILFFKKILHTMGFLGYLPKLKKESGTSLWCTFSTLFFHKNVLYLILYQWTKF